MYCHTLEMKKKIKYKISSSHSSSNSGANVGVLFFIKLGQTKVRYLRVKVPIEKYIVCFDVPMNNFQC